MFSYALADLRASSDGRSLGRRYGHDPYALARHLGVSVKHVPLASLQAQARPSVTITGQLFRLPGCPQVSIADGLTPYEDRRVLAHELGHHLGFPDERLCDQFADAFLRVDDDELPGAAWREIQGELLGRARRAVRLSPL